MKINWKVRFKNKAFVLSFLMTIIAFVYQLLGMFGIVPSISEDTASQIIGLLANVLVSIGVLVDPTTKGLSDGGEQ